MTGAGAVGNAAIQLGRWADAARAARDFDLKGATYRPTGDAALTTPMQVVDFGQLTALLALVSQISGADA